MVAVFIRKQGKMFRKHTVRTGFFKIGGWDPIPTSDSTAAVILFFPGGQMIRGSPSFTCKSPLSVCNGAFTAVQQLRYAENSVFRTKRNVAKRRKSWNRLICNIKNLDNWSGEGVLILRAEGREYEKRKWPCAKNQHPFVFTLNWGEKLAQAH